jgi:hypothetical protein
MDAENQADVEVVEVNGNGRVGRRRLLLGGVGAFFAGMLARTDRAEAAANPLCLDESNSSLARTSWQRMGGDYVVQLDMDNSRGPCVVADTDDGSAMVCVAGAGVSSRVPIDFEGSDVISGVQLDDCGSTCIGNDCGTRSIQVCGDPNDPCSPFSTFTPERAACDAWSNDPAASAVAARNRVGWALKTEGKTQLPGGRGVIEAGQDMVQVMDPRVGTPDETNVSLMLTSNPGRRAGKMVTLHWVEVIPGVGFIPHMTDQVELRTTFTYELTSRVTHF